MFTPDDVMEGAKLQGQVVIYDDDGTYLGSAIAEKLRAEGRNVTLLTPAVEVAPWTALTMEQKKIHKRLLELDVKLVTQQRLSGIGDGTLEMRCIHTGRPSELVADCVVVIGTREPSDEVYRDLMARPEALEAAGIKSVDLIGDCLAPHLIAAAVFAGHEYARNLDAAPREDVPFAREQTRIS